MNTPIVVPTVVGAPRPLVSPTGSRAVKAPWSPLIFTVYLLLIGTAEVITALVDPLLGVAFHAVLLLGLLVHGALGRTLGERHLALGLSLAPLIRLLSLMVPLMAFPQPIWYPLVSGPLLWATWLIARHAGLSAQALGLRAGRWRLQLLVMAGGLGLGAVEYAILHTSPRINLTDPWAVGGLAVSLILFTGISEEVIFRGLIQAVAGPVLGRGSLIYVALLFGVLHMGYHSLVDIVFVAAVGLLFGYIVHLSGSVLGVALAHGLSNVTLFLLMPALVSAPLVLGTLAAVGIGAGTLAALIGIGLLWRDRAAPHNRISTAFPPPCPVPAPADSVPGTLEPASTAGQTWQATTLAQLLAEWAATRENRDH